MQSLISFEKFPIGKLFDFPKTNSKITKKFCNEHIGNIPVYASSKDEKSTLGFIEDNLKNVKYYNNCLSWNRNGSVGYVFIRNHRFATNEDHRALIIKKEFKDKLDKLYLKFEIERQLFLNGFSFLNKCGVDKIKEVNILIPIDKEGEFDLIEQKKFAKKYQDIQELKIKIQNIFEKLIRLEINISDKYEIKIPFVTDIFDVEKGNAKYTKRYIHEHKGKYPVYSSQTSNLGEIGSIDTYDYNEECFTWTTDGTYVGTVFYRNGKFSITTHCGILRVKDEYKGKVDFEYLKFILNQTLQNYRLGEGSNKRIGVERLSEIPIEIPVDDEGKYDPEKQKEIADKYKKIEEIKRGLKDYYERIITSKVQII